MGAVNLYTWLLFAITFLLIVITYFSFFYVLEGIREFRKMELHNITYLILWVIISILSIIFAINKSENFLAIETISIILGCLLNYLLLQIDLKNLFALSLFSFSIICFSENLLSNFFFIFNKYGEFNYAPFLYICIITIIWGFYIVIGRKIEKDSLLLPTALMLFAGIMSLTVCFLLSFITFLSKKGFLGSFSKAISIMNTAVTIIIITVIFFLIYYYNGKRLAEFEIKYTELINKQQKEYYNQLMEKENDTRQYRHDIIAQLIHVEYSLSNKQYKRASHFISDMLKEISYISQSDYDVGNDTVNTMLNFYLTQLKKTDISINVTGYMPQEIVVSDRDLCIIISNLLNNAKEAVEKMESNNRFISINITSGNRFWSFHISNSTYNSQFDVTSKSDSKNHGYGIANIMNYVKKYNGVYKFNIQRGTFNAEIKMPI